MVATRNRRAVAGGRLASLALVAVLSGVAQTSAAQTGLERVTMDAAIQRALEHNPQAVQARATVESAEWGARRASAAYLPSLSVSSSAGVSGSGTIGGDPTLPAAAGIREGYSAGLSASYELYSGGRRGAEVDRTRAEISSAESQLAEREFAIVLATQRAFFEVARAADLVEVAQARLATVQQSHEAADRRMRVGSATGSDVLRAELELSRARQALLEAENQHRNAMFALGRAVGNDGPVDVQLTERETQLRQLGMSGEELVSTIVGASPAVITASAGLTSAQASVRTASAQYLPRVTVSSGYDWSASQLSFDESRTGWSLRLGVSLPVFDNYQRAANVADARNRSQTAAVQLADARRGAEVEAERLIGALRLAEQRVALSEEAVRVAEEDLRVQQTRYDLGTSTMLDQITSQTALAEARQSLIAARYDYQIAYAELEALAGREL